MSFIEILKAIAFGIVEGFTEWLPISSTAHIMILNEFIGMNESEEFINVFMTVVQFGTLAALLLIYGKKLNPFYKKKKPEQKRATWRLWVKILIATIPAAVLGFLLDDWIETNLHNGLVVALSLMVYGVAFIVFEYFNRYKQPTITRLGKIDYQTALYIGFFQVLALVPGTSRSAAAILGAMLLGCSRSISTEFSFFIGIPVVFGTGLLRLINYTGTLSSAQVVYLLVGCIFAFFVALYSIGFLLNWIKKNNFTMFGFYRIALGAVILIWYIVSQLINA